MLCFDFNVWRRIPAIQHAYSAVFFSLFFIAAAADALCSLWQNGGQLNMMCRNKAKEKRPAAFDQTEPSHCLVFVITCPWLCGCYFTPQNVVRSKWNHLKYENEIENKHLMLFFLLIVAEAKRCELEIAFWVWTDVCMCVCCRFWYFDFQRTRSMRTNKCKIMILMWNRLSNLFLFFAFGPIPISYHFGKRHSTHVADNNSWKWIKSVNANGECAPNEN